MTYNVFGGTLNLAQSISHGSQLSMKAVDLIRHCRLIDVRYMTVAVIFILWSWTDVEFTLSIMGTKPHPFHNLRLPSGILCEYQVSK